MSSYETTESIIILLKRLGKWVAIAFVVLIGIWVLILAWLKFNTWYSIDRHKANVEVVAFFDYKNCTKEYPLFIGVVNNSSKTIESISTNVKVTKRGYSSRLNYDTSYSSDKILLPAEGWGSCWKVFSDNYDSNYDRKPLDGDGMEVVVTSFYPIFKDKD